MKELDYISLICLMFNFNNESHNKRWNLDMVYPPLIFTIKKQTTILNELNIMMPFGSIILFTWRQYTHKERTGSPVDWLPFSCPRGLDWRCRRPRSRPVDCETHGSGSSPPQSHTLSKSEFIIIILLTNLNLPWIYFRFN